MMTPSHFSASHHFLIRFTSLFNEGRALAFPCDAAGTVAMDDLSEHARENYLFARAMVGREFALPCVLPEDATLAA